MKMIKTKTCRYCGNLFVPKNEEQKFCVRQCQTRYECTGTSPVTDLISVRKTLKSINNLGRAFK